MSTEPSPSPATEPEVHPSSTPEGPQVIPTHGTPAGEPGPDPSDPAEGEEGMHEVPFDNRDSNPNGAGPLGTSGGMGVSSERTGPAGTDPRMDGIQGTGSRGGAVTGTDGTFDVQPQPWDAPEVSGGDLGPETSLADDPDTDTDTEGVDRTVGEPKPLPIEDEKLRRRT